MELNLNNYKSHLRTNGRPAHGVYAINKKGIILFFKTITEASTKTGVSETFISRSINKRDYKNRKPVTSWKGYSFYCEKTQRVNIVYKERINKNDKKAVVYIKNGKTMFFDSFSELEKYYGKRLCYHGSLSDPKQNFGKNGERFKLQGGYIFSINDPEWRKYSNKD